MNARKPRVEIEYCSQCRFILRAGWMAQELLSTFMDELGEVALLPGTGGVFEVRLNGETIFSRKTEGRFPESKELKQLIRDRIAPEKDLGHSDKK
ncbi:MAG: SelT/SelW/SelH family protein [Gammaproteobacteria bacterium]|nr:MAG: SelT/SelW/SelH family protein [Gammaproteobacteria bacterium]